MISKSTAKKSATSAKTSSKSSPTAPVTPPAVTSSSSAATSPKSVVAPISAGVVAQCNSLLGQVGALIGPVEQLSAADIRRMLKLRKGGVQVITQVLDLCNQHGITSVGTVTVQNMSAQLARATARNQIGVQMSAVPKALTDASFSAESDSWQCATALYTTLRRLAIVNPTLAAGLQPVQAFFKTKKTVGKVRATKAKARVSAASKTEEKYASLTETAAPPAAVAPGAGASSTSSTSSTSAAPSGSSGAAPTASVVPASNGATHS